MLNWAIVQYVTSKYTEYSNVCIFGVAYAPYCIVLNFQFPLELPNGDGRRRYKNKDAKCQLKWDYLLNITYTCTGTGTHSLFSISLFPFCPFSCTQFAPYLYTICRSKWLQLSQNNWCMRFSLFTNSISIHMRCDRNVNTHTLMCHVQCVLHKHCKMHAHNKQINVYNEAHTHTHR